MLLRLLTSRDSAAVGRTKGHSPPRHSADSATVPVLSHGVGILLAMHADSGRRYRAYPHPGQAERLISWGHSCRVVWNLALEQRRFAWLQRAHTVRSAEQCRHLTDARADLSWLADLPTQSAQQVLRQLDRAYDNWWNPGHPAQAPTFRKRSRGLSVPFPGQAVQVRTCSRRWAEVRLPKLGWVRFRLSRPLGGTVRNATVSKDALGWHISFGVATATKPGPPNRLPGCGVDFGVACSAFVSDERGPRLMPSTLTAGQRRRLLGLERRKARQVTWAKKHNGGRFSNRLRRTISDIAKLRARQARRRQDFTHKLTTDLAKNHGWVAVEDLRVKAMTKSARGTREEPARNVKAKAGLNRAILDNAPYERQRQLAYKAPKFGSELRLVRPAFTSQRCSACGLRDPESRPGCGRLFACTACGHVEHADLNAARNIHNLAAGQAVHSTRSHLRAARPFEPDA
jgi:putative transposase